LLERKTVKNITGHYAVLDEFPDNSVHIKTGDPIEESKGLQSNNPGFPGFRTSGIMYNGGIKIEIKY